MSAQRRRVLESDKGETTITDNGVYIEGLNGKFYTVDNWHGGNYANSIAIASGGVKFRIALTEPSSKIKMGDINNDPLEKYMTAISGKTAAKADYNGSGNTANILKAQPSPYYAAGYCNAFTFPDGKTKGFVPSLGQLNLAYQNKSAVDAAINKCGGTAIIKDYYWSSTFYGLDINGGRYCWILSWSDGNAISQDLSSFYVYVRPFADLT